MEKMTKMVILMTTMMMTDEHSPSTHQKYNGIIMRMARMTRKMVGFLDANDTNFAHQESCRK